MPSAGTASSDYVVRVWHAHVDVLRRTPDTVTQALSWLTPTERERHLRYRRDVDREMFVLGRVLARAIVGDALGVPPTSWAWRDGARGRPEVDLAESPVAFNIAHSGGLVACALSWHGEVGVDIEDRRRPPIDRDLVARCCSTAEATDVLARGAEGWRDRFLQYWTLKEAYLKARGLGISVHLADLNFSIREPEITLHTERAHTRAPWAFELISLHADHFLAVAAPELDGHRPVFRFEPFPVHRLP